MRLETLFFSLVTILSAALYAEAVSAQSISEPNWPQSFVAATDKPAGVVFVVTQPGPISVSVQSAAPILVTLFGPLPKPVQQQGAGNLQLEYVATAADVQRSYLWTVQISSSAPQPVQGMISVSHPPANMSLASMQIQLAQKRYAQHHASDAARQAVANQAIAAQEQAKQQAQQQLASAQALKTQQLLKSLGAPAVQSRGISTPIAAVGTPTTLRPSITGPIPPPPPPPPPPPTISSLSVSEGQPGDPVLIGGSSLGFSGQVHFLVNPGMDLVAPVDYWSNTQILAHVPKASGILRYVGSVYVSTPYKTVLMVQPVFQPSPPQQFIFDPLIDSQIISVSALDKNVANPNGGCTEPWVCGSGWNASLCSVPIPGCSANHYSWIGSFTGYDEWYLVTTLQNGWLVDSASLLLDCWDSQASGPGNASIVTSRPGTPSLYTKVQWSETTQMSQGGLQTQDACYGLFIKIKGPLGVTWFGNAQAAAQ